MPAAMLTPHTPPPEDYYQNNCCTLFGFVLRHYKDLLTERQRQQLVSFLEASDDAQRLFARLLTRKGPLLRLDSLQYAEVNDTPAALRELADYQLIVLQPAAPADQLLSLLRKDELMAAFCPTQPKRLRKTELIDHILSNRSDAQIFHKTAQTLDWLGLSYPDLWWLARLLFFGDTAQDWSTFVIRDLGMVRYEAVAMRSKRFKSVSDLSTDLEFRHLSRLTKRLEDYPALAGELVAQLQQPVADRFIARRRERSLLRVARWLERNSLPGEAVQAYRQVGRHPARERIVRLLHKQGDTSSAELWLTQIRTAPFSEEETQFALRFGKRQAGYQPPVTQIDIPAARPDIEQQALELILQPGQWGVHVENTLVRTFTGLIYWQAIFADVPGAFTNPFQFGPNDLYAEDFAQVRQAEIDLIERRMADDRALCDHLENMLTHKFGVANSLVNWGLFNEIPLDAYLDALPFDDLRRLCAFMVRNLHDRRAGLPDLFVVHGPKSYEFVEVKGPNDQLQPGQRVWCAAGVIYMHARQGVLWKLKKALPRNAPCRKNVWLITLVTLLKYRWRSLLPVARVIVN